MGVEEAALLRAAVAHLERYRSAIDDEVNRRLARAEPAPEVRAEVIRRFRTFVRLASLSPDAARVSLDGLGGNSALALENTIQTAVAVANSFGATPELAGALVDMEARFRSGVRRILAPEEREEKRERSKKRPTPNAGRRVRGAIDRISDTYVALNLDSSAIFDVNPAAEALFATDAARLIGSSLSAFIAPADQLVWRELESRLDAGEDSGPIELTVARPNGDYVPVELTIASHSISGKRLAIFIARERVKPALDFGGRV
ncbi:MAG: PAS domain S-box protein [Deltaproteobacteria bacterium]|nr:PAS domain S-box protein [Deltaproteobacteria bacterium]